IYLEALSNYTRLHLINKKIIVTSRTLKTYEKILPTSFFYRVHNSYIVNSRHICNINTQGTILLSQNLTIPIARRRKKEINCKIKQTEVLKVAV
ncbi:MAG TPA: LytTR family transcriptional regulator DNA-binding domain-containing protein, partial [Ferruginibacter sp.]|nr:LytTR family transcriptional regulator DNA-binding domain-containing protein [Ferruginibacter sp.]